MKINFLVMSSRRICGCRYAMRRRNLIIVNGMATPKRKPSISKDSNTLSPMDEQGSGNFRTCWFEEKLPKVLDSVHPFFYPISYSSRLYRLDDAALLFLLECDQCVTRLLCNTIPLLFVCSSEMMHSTDARAPSNRCLSQQS